MEKALTPFAPYAYAIMRIILGLLFVCRGGQKLFGWFGGQPVPLASLFGLAGIIEIVLGLLITVGLLTSYAAFIASGEMAVAYFIGHLPKSFWPLQKAGEPTVCFCIWRPRVPASGVSMRLVGSAIEIPRGSYKEGFLGTYLPRKIPRRSPELRISRAKQSLAA